MKKLITYILFGTERLYWENVPYQLIAANAMYPDFILRFYIHKNSTINNCYFDLLKEISENTDKVEIEIIDREYVGTQLTCWRLKPLWEKDAEILLCRDIDSAMQKLERTAVEYFLTRSLYIAHNIRAYILHTIPFMAGLCGFKVKKVQPLLFAYISSFDALLDWAVKESSGYREGKWGCDQSVLNKLMYHAGILPHTLQCPQYTAELTVSGVTTPPCLPSEYLNIEIPNTNKEVLNFLESISRGFTGQTFWYTQDSLKILCDMINNEITTIIKKRGFV